MDDLDGLGKYVGGGTDSLADNLAEAWIVLSCINDGSDKSNRPNEQLPSYLADDWAKDVQRRLRGWAEKRARPMHWPWDGREFDHFEWRQLNDSQIEENDG